MNENTPLFAAGNGHNNLIRSLFTVVVAACSFAASESQGLKARSLANPEALAVYSGPRLGRNQV